jgi:aminopeptidase N
MYEDGFSSSQPIQVEIIRADDMPLLFDSVFYSKNSAVLRMLEAVIGEIEFQKAVKVCSVNPNLLIQLMITIEWL